MGLSRISLPSFAESRGCEPVDECEVGTLRSLGEVGYASEGFARRSVWRGATAVRPWGSTCGASLSGNFRRTSTYVDKILQGAKPADLAVKQPMKFDFVINLQTAKKIGLTISPVLLARVNRLIK